MDLHITLTHHHTLADQGGHLKTILIFDHHLVFPLETPDNAASCRIQEADFITYFHCQSIR